MPDNQLSFRISSGLKSIIGKNLITDDFIAVFELVKNSFDAHAKNVVITFEEERIIIADDGKGMSKQDIVDKWLFVAYSAKTDGSEDQEFNDNETYRDKIQAKRFFAGAKGIGRFSSDRLGKKLVLTSRKIGENSLEQIEVDWKKFEEKLTTEFENISVPHKTLRSYGLKFPNDSEHGTILEIITPGYWDREALIRLKHSLEKLINPFIEKDDFTVSIVCERERSEDENGVYKRKPNKGQKYSKRDKVNGPVENAILDILELKTTSINVVITGNEITTKILDRTSTIYEIKEKNNKYPLLHDAKIDIFFLNRAAKRNFTIKMGIEPVNFGSIFLFLNGFRVQPFGSVQDDSWGIDYRSQQGYNRFLGTRDLFGRVDLTTNLKDQFIEVSSRDGGLVETPGYHQLMAAFELAHRRLERYVVGILWGEGFIRKNYFGEDESAKIIAKQYRDKLEDDKDNEDFSKLVSDNLGSKLDFIQLIKSLADDKNIEIVDYNRQLVDLVNGRLDDLNPKFLKDLEKIADSVDDEDLKDDILTIKDQIEKLQEEKLEAERKALEEEQKRILADEERRKAEQIAKEEQEKRKEAELATARKEKELLEAELATLKAEKAAKEEEERRLEEERKNKELNDQLDLEKQKSTYLSATRKTLSDDAEQLVHSIDLYVGNASSYLNAIITSDENLSNKTREELYTVKTNIDRALKVGQLIIKSNFDYKSTNHKIDLAKYIEEYFDVVSIARDQNLKISVNNNIEHIAYLSTLEIDIIIDNLISNSIKAGAENVLVNLEIKNDKLIMNYFDDGTGLSEKFLNNPDAIFELGTRVSDHAGSGIGMYDIKKRITDLKGDIKILGNGMELKGAGFQLIFE
jgi:signal transduction histidine kinase